MMCKATPTIPQGPTREHPTRDHRIQTLSGSCHQGGRCCCVHAACNTMPLLAPAAQSETQLSAPSVPVDTPEPASGDVWKGSLPSSGSRRSSSMADCRQMDNPSRETGSPHHHSQPLLLLMLLALPSLLPAQAVTAQLQKRPACLQPCMRGCTPCCLASFGVCCLGGAACPFSVALCMRAGFICSWCWQQPVHQAVSPAEQDTGLSLGTAWALLCCSCTWTAAHLCRLQDWRAGPETNLAPNRRFLFPAREATAAKVCPAAAPFLGEQAERLAVRGQILLQQAVMDLAKLQRILQCSVLTNVCVCSPGGCTGFQPDTDS